MEVFIICLLLVLTVVLGGMLVVFLERKNQNSIIKMSLAFSGGFLLAVSFTHFIPELYIEHHTQIGVWILVGFLVQLFLEYFSGGIEHGHIHVHNKGKIPWMLLLSLSIHSFIEGIPLANGEAHHHHGAAESHQHSLLLGIVLHQFPVAIALMTLFLKSALSKKTSWLLLLLFALMTPSGTVFGIFVPTEGTNDFMAILLAVVVGMLLHISTTIIFETSEDHRFNFKKLLAILLGVGLNFLLI